jgi:hypothetical protein
MLLIVIVVGFYFLSPTLRNLDANIKMAMAKAIEKKAGASEKVES